MAVLVLSLVVASRGYSLVVVQRILTAVASLWSKGSRHTALVVVARGL